MDLSRLPNPQSGDSAQVHAVRHPPASRCEVRAGARGKNHHRRGQDRRGQGRTEHLLRLLRHPQPQHGHSLQAMHRAPGQGKAREAGAVLGGLQDKPAPPVKCPSCGAENPAMAHTCAKCGAPLVKAAPPPPPPAAKRGCVSLPLLIGIGAVILIAIVAFIVMGSRSKAVVGEVSDIYWRRAIAIEAFMPVTREDWRTEIPETPRSGAAAKRSAAPRASRSRARARCAARLTSRTRAAATAR